MCDNVYNVPNGEANLTRIAPTFICHSQLTRLIGLFICYKVHNLMTVKYVGLLCVKMLKLKRFKHVFSPYRANHNSFGDIKDVVAKA